QRYHFVEYYKVKFDAQWFTKITGKLVLMSQTRFGYLGTYNSLDRAGVRAVGYDVLFHDRSPQDPIGDEALEAMGEGGNGRFVFGASRVNSDYDTSKGATFASQAPNGFSVSSHAHKPGLRVALLLPFGKAMAAHSALLDPTRGNNAIIRDVPTREDFGGWAMPSLPLQLAVVATHRTPQSFPASVRPNWRKHSQLPFISAANVIEGRTICRDADNSAPPVLKDSIALVGYTASGLNDAKPTPVSGTMPGVEVLGEATEALVNNSAIWMPPKGMKYILAGILVLLASFAFYRGEPANDVDSVFVATNLLLLTLAFCGLTFFGAFFDIFASIGFLSLCFGLCRLYAGVQRGRAVGNGDFRVEFDPSVDRWLVMARLRFLPYPSLEAASAARRKREYRRRLRRFLYAGCDAVMLEGIVERKSWLHATLDDLVVLVWKGEDEASAWRAAAVDLDALHAQFNEHDDRLDDDGTIKVSVVAAAIDDDRDNSDRGERLRLREVLGRVLNAEEEWPLRAENPFTDKDGRIATT
ncbi:MAG: hypothetical protein JWL98_2076, partial [Xanthomonadaceae bacterium]|nr:hypothetical protein [Xanthomonadaceae bacterium]